MGTDAPPRERGHADTANLLLSLSGMHSSDAAAEAEPDVPMGLDPPVTPITAPAVVSSLPTPMNPLPTSSAALNGADANWAAKQRRLQVSALPRKEWSADEDALIRNGVERLGCRWRLIAAQLPGRSDDAVRIHVLARRHPAPYSARLPHPLRRTAAWSGTRSHGCRRQRACALADRSAHGGILAGAQSVEPAARFPPRSGRPERWRWLAERLQAPVEGIDGERQAQVAGWHDGVA